MSLIDYRRKIKGNLTIKEAIKSDGESLILLRNKYNKFEVLNYLSIHIAELSEFIGLTLSANIVNDLSRIIFNKIYYYNLEEVAVLFNWLKEQKYFSRTANEILLNVDNFLDIRLSAAESLSINTHKNVKNQNLAFKDDFIEKFYEFKKKNPISKDAIDKRKEKDEQFERFKAEYYRLKSIKS